MPDTIRVMLSLIIIIVFLLLFLLLELSSSVSFSPTPPSPSSATVRSVTSCLQSLSASVSSPRRTRRTATTPHSCDSAFTVAVTPGTGWENCRGVALEGVDIEGEAAHEMGRVSEGSGRLAVDCNTTRSETIDRGTPLSLPFRYTDTPYYSFGTRCSIDTLLAVVQLPLSHPS